MSDEASHAPTGIQVQVIPERVRGLWQLVAAFNRLVQAVTTLSRLPQPTSEEQYAEWQAFQTAWDVREVALAGFVGTFTEVYPGIFQAFLGMQIMEEGIEALRASTHAWPATRHWTELEIAAASIIKSWDEMPGRPAGAEPPWPTDPVVPMDSPNI